MEQLHIPTLQGAGPFQHYDNKLGGLESLKRGVRLLKPTLQFLGDSGIGTHRGRYLMALWLARDAMLGTPSS